jgi:hypothetical protein
MKNNIGMKHDMVIYIFMFSKKKHIYLLGKHFIKILMIILLAGRINRC